MNRLSLTPAATQPLRATLLRTVSIALIIGTIVTLVTRGMPADAGAWRGWSARVAAVLWISLGGHYVELFYLCCVLPRIAADEEPRSVPRWFFRLGARCAAWAVGGAVLWIGGMMTYQLLMNGEWPRVSELPMIALQGALGLIVVELFGVHLVLTILGHPSAWLRRNGRWG